MLTVVEGGPVNEIRCGDVWTDPKGNRWYVWNGRGEQIRLEKMLPDRVTASSSGNLGFHTNNAAPRKTFWLEELLTTWTREHSNPHPMATVVWKRKGKVKL